MQQHWRLQETVPNNANNILSNFKNHLAPLTEWSRKNASGADDTVALTVKNDMVGHFLEIPANWEITAIILVDRLLQHIRVTLEKKQNWRLRATIKRRECLKWPHSFPTLSRFFKNVMTYTSNVQDWIQSRSARN